MSWIWAILAVMLLSFTSFDEATAQPLGWSSQSYLLGGVRHLESLRVFNMATGVVENTFEAPAGVHLGSGALTPDGRFYLVPTSVGIAHFRTNPPSFDRIVGPPVAVNSVAVDPIGTRVHAVGDFGHAVLNWDTGTVSSVACCAQPRILFTPDGGIRVHVEDRAATVARETVVSAFSGSGNDVLWTRTVPGIGAVVAISPADVAVGVYPEIVVWSVTDGVARGRIPVFASAMAWRGSTLLVTRRMSQPTPFERLNRLSAYDVPALVERIVVDRPVPTIENDSGPVGLVVSRDQRHAYWLIYTSSLGISVSSTSYVVVDLETNAVVAGSDFGYQSQGDLVLDASDLCLFDGPTELTASVEGGIVGIPVVPAPNCRPWSVGYDPFQVILNPGPHVGPASILVNVKANSWGSSVALPLDLGGRRVVITQPSGVPARPELDVVVTANRAILSWVPAVGGGIRSFGVRGAAAVQPIVDVAGVVAAVRTWTSPPLPVESYVVEVFAENDAGRSLPSNHVRFSIGVSERPDPPVGLSGHGGRRSCVARMAAGALRTRAVRLHRRGGARREPVVCRGGTHRHPALCRHAGADRRLAGASTSPHGWRDEPCCGSRRGDDDALLAAPGPPHAAMEPHCGGEPAPITARSLPFAGRHRRAGRSSITWSRSAAPAGAPTLAG